MVNGESRKLQAKKAPRQREELTNSKTKELSI
jgi:hypothetical protein